MDEKPVEVEMTKKTKGIAIGFTIIGLIIGLILSSNLGIQTKAYTGSAEISPESMELLSKVGTAMVEVVNAAKPAVVNISTTRVVKYQGHPGFPFMEDPFFKRFFGDQFSRQFQQPQERKLYSLGSGVVADKEGHILTNYHVIKDAEEIKVTLSDNREFKGKVLGSDPKSDLAVVKIEAKDLPYIDWGDSDKLQVGEPVFAVGSPYGLSQTVTFGIVSAKGRANVEISDYEDFIQTDAAINPGNSGGPLVNMKGQIVGINTAIFSTTGGYQGIGFSIPSSMAKVVLESLIKHGKVIRGWLGVTIQPVTPEIAKQFKLKEEKGVVVSDVTQDSPAAKAGLKRGDVIINYRGQDVEDPITLRNLVAATAPDTKADITVIRDGKEKKLTVVIGELPEKEMAPGGPGNALSGIHVQDLTPQLRKTLGIPERLNGVVVADTERNVGLQRGDLIMEVDRVEIDSVKAFDDVASKIEPGSDVLLLVWRNGQVFYLTISGGGGQ
jgi:serine protease Do